MYLQNREQCWQGKEHKLAEGLYSLKLLTDIKLPCWAKQLKYTETCWWLDNILGNTQIYCVFQQAKEKVKNLGLNDSTQIEIILAII